MAGFRQANLQLKKDIDELKKKNEMLTKDLTIANRISETREQIVRTWQQACANLQHKEDMPKSLVDALRKTEELHAKAMQTEQEAVATSPAEDNQGIAQPAAETASVQQPRRVSAGVMAEALPEPPLIQAGEEVPTSDGRTVTFLGGLVAGVFTVLALPLLPIASWLHWIPTL